MPSLRLVYLVPADCRETPEFTLAIGRAAQHVQRWYWDQLEGSGTFRLSEPLVEVVTTPHEAAWYGRNPCEGGPPGWYWSNAVADAVAAAGVRLDDPGHRWAVYLDAELAPGQNGGSAAGIAVMHRYDLLGLCSRNVLAGLNEDRVCRWVGGLAHELGHTFGLPHPEPCERDPAHANCRGLMYFGYRDYPDTWLLAEERELLRASPFLTAQAPFGAVSRCENLILP